MSERGRFGTLSGLLTLALAAVSGPVLGTVPPDRVPYSVEILVDGRPLPEYAARGTTYVEALRGKEYSVRLTNRTGRRVAVALSVDGLNTIDARVTGASDAAKWILGPHASIVLDGWQTGEGTARRFFFTTEDRSYGAWIGETENLGVVSAAFFRERIRRPEPVPYETRSALRERPTRAAPEAAGESAAAAAPGAKAQSEAISDDFAATGIGREVEHRVREVSFDEEPTAAAVVSMRYEFRDALVRLGVIPPRDDALARRERARGFRDLRFAPDPYR